MPQTRLLSLGESVANVAAGFGVGLVTQILVFPLFGISVRLVDQFGIAAIFTAVGIVKTYAVRRAFNGIRSK